MLRLYFTRLFAKMSSSEELGTLDVQGAFSVEPLLKIK